MKKIIPILLLLSALGLLNSCKTNEVSPLSPGEGSLLSNVLGRIDADSLLSVVEILSGTKGFYRDSSLITIVSRNAFNSSNELAEEFLSSKLKFYCKDVTIENFRENGNNIIAVIPGTKYPDRKIYICAHFDDMPLGTTAPGADDNATGCAIVLEAARVLSKYELNYTIVFALWDFEEQGLYGSTHHANKARAANTNIDAVLNVDMIGYDHNNDNKLLLTLPAVKFPVSLTEKSEMINKEFNIGLAPQTTNLILSSDHIPFLNNNYNSILFIEDVLSDKNPFYHADYDILSGINKPYLVRCSKLAIATLAYLANRE